MLVSYWFLSYCQMQSFKKLVKSNFSTFCQLGFSYSDDLLVQIVVDLDTVE